MKRQSLSKNITGILILIVGLVLLLNALQLINLGSLASDYWPLAIVLGGIIVLINSWRSWPAAAFLVALGAIYQLREMAIISTDPWQFIWPLVLVFVGASIMFSRSHGNKHFRMSDQDSASAILAGVNINGGSKKFTQSSATAIMGGVRLDLRQVEFDKNALIDVFALWGGVEVVVPENVIVIDQTSNILAGTEHKTQQKTAKNSPTLTITGTLIMAGVSVRNQPSDY